MPSRNKGNHIDRPSFDELISLKEASKFCDLSPDHLRRLAEKGEIWARKIGRNWVTTKASVQEYLARNVKPGPKKVD